MTSEEARVPNSKQDWKAIDIFVFSNGQQYSPPRKYHLRSKDLNLWNSTLNFLAKTQYGPSHGVVELYTIEGAKVATPLELSNGAAYVAVDPQDKFIYAGYDKYLIRASRSWEKRQAKKTEDVKEPEKSEITSQIERIDVKDKDPNTKSQEESAVLKTIVSSVVVHDASQIVKPQPLSTTQKMPESLQIPIVKPIEKKRPLNQRPAIIKKIIPPAPPALSEKPSVKKKDSIKIANVKITRTEGDKNVFSGTAGNQFNKLSTKSKIYKPTTRPKELLIHPGAVLPKFQETTNELKTITNKNDRKLSTISTDLKNVIDDKEIVLVSNLYENPNRDMPSVAVNIIEIPPTPLKRHTTTENNENLNQKAEENQKVNNEIKMKGTKCSENNSSPRNISTFNDKPSDEQYTALTVSHTLEENKNQNNEVHNMPETINSLPLKSSLNTNKVSDDQHSNITIHNVAHKVDKNINLNNELKVNAPENNEKLNEFPPTPLTATEKQLDDQYVAVLKKGDVVNLKVNIEIQNYDCGLTNYNGNAVKLHSNLIYSEKGSQINMANQIVAQNKSLLSLIKKEVKDHHIGDNHHVIIVQYSCCKYCNNQNIAMQKRTSKNYVVVFPMEHFEEEILGCQCDQPQDQIRHSSVVAPVKATYSCMSLQRLTKSSHAGFPAETELSNITTPVLKTENLLLDTKISEKDVILVTRKKSVAINAETGPQTELITSSTEWSRTLYVSVVEKSTQTEWCDVMLEARLLEDGHYTFHLPSLELLKHYKLA